MKTPYPTYDVLAKWDTPSFNDQTRAVVAQRLDSIPERQFFEQEEWRLLEAIVARLIPQPDRIKPVPITPWIDEQLAQNRGEGFRRSGMPPMCEAWRQGLSGIDAEAHRLFNRGFADLDPGSQDATLHAIQRGEVGEAFWAKLSPDLFFTDILLKTVAGIYYAHPAAWNEIGYGGPAGPRGYVRLGFNERDPWEAKEVR